MNCKFKIFMLNIIVVLVLIFANFSHSDAATRSWDVGDLFLFSYSNYSYANTTNTDFVVSDILVVSIKEEGTYNITRVDLSNNTYASIFTGVAGSGSNLLNYFGWEEFTNYQLDPNSFFTITYDWDYGHNEIVLTYFNFGLIENWPFIEPQGIELIYS